jgi:hypothetical protein
VKTGIGVFVGVGVTVAAPEPHPLRSTAIELTKATKIGGPCLKMITRPSIPRSFHTIRPVP